MNWKNIKLLILDNDGVLTDGSIIYDNLGNEWKMFSAKDGLGIKLLEFTDIQIAVITGKTSQLLAKRCAELGIKKLYQGIRNKLKTTRNLLRELELDWENVAYLGDDWNDFPVMKRSAISAVTNDSFPDLKKKVDIILQNKGGENAVREFIEMILKKKGIYEETLAKFIDHLEHI